MAYGHHHTSIRWLCMVRKELHDTEMQMWSSSNEPEVGRCSVLDNKLLHDILGDVRKGAGNFKLYLTKIIVDNDVKIR